MPPAEDFTIQYQQIDQALRAGKLQAAAQVFQELISLHPDLDALGHDIGRILLGLFEDLHTAAMWAFADYLGRHPAEEVAAGAIAAIEPRRAGIREWRRILMDLNQESQARRLMAQIRSRDVEAAAVTAKAILERAKSPDKLEQVARQLGVILGSLDHDQDRVDQVIKQLQRIAPLDAGAQVVLQTTRRETLDSAGQTALSQRELMWNQAHTEAVVRLIRALPGGAGGVQSTPEQEQRFLNAMQEMLGACFSDPGIIEFIDIVRVMNEFAPVDSRSTGPVQGVEDVAFLRITPMDRLVSVRTLRTLGEKPRLVEQVLEAARVYREGRAAEMLLSLMGGLSSPEFFSYLAAALRDKRFSRQTASIIEALGRIGDAKSLRVLQDLYEEFCRSKLIDPPMRRLISLCIASLGRIARHPKTTAEERDAIVLRAIKALPEDRPLWQEALHHFYGTYDPAGLSDEAKRYAVRYIVAGLWSPENKSKLAKANEGQRTELGFREEIVDILVAMGPSILPMLTKEAEPRIMQYSGAYWALGEAMEKIADDNALPFLERMLMNTLVTDESAIPERLRETYFDSARDEFVPLPKDKVAHSLMYAIQKRCGLKGKRLLLNIGKSIESGRYQAPGPQSATLLREMMVEEKLREEAQKRSLPEPASEPLENLQDLDLDRMLAETAPAETHRPREREDVDKILHDIRGKGLFGVKTEKRVSAIQEAAARRMPEAIAPLCELLVQKDVILRAAAEAALHDIAVPSSPTSAADKTCLAELLEALRKAHPDVVTAIIQMLTRMHPTHEPLKTLLLRFVEGESDAKMKEKIARVFKIVHERESSAARTSGGLSIEAEEAGELDAEVIVEQGENTSKKLERIPQEGPMMDFSNLSPQQKLNIRRQYFAERRQWLQNNKRGPEPKRPPGID